MSKIAVVTDMDFNGSGYYYISVPIFTKLVEMGHDVKIAGLSYTGQPHDYPFSIIPSKDTGDAGAIVHNLCVMPHTSPDVIIVAMDIPLCMHFYDKFFQYKKKFVAITPLENGPLTMSWSAGMFNFDWTFFISELGKQEALKAGLSKVDHIQVGVDSNLWHIPTPEERGTFRKGMGFTDELVILTVADNQERKNLWAAMDVTARLKQSGRKVKHIIVTRVDSPYGWKLRDLAVRLDINQEVMLMNRGMPTETLWSLYAMSDCFLLTSKAEGLGMILLEAMASGLPVVGTDTGAIHELLWDGRGYLVPPEYEFIDVWGNSKRDMIDRLKAVEAIQELADGKELREGVIERARAYVETRTWDIPAKQLDEKIKELVGEKVSEIPPVPTQT